MLLSGDDLSIQLFVAALAISILSIAVTQADWRGRKFVVGLFVSAGFLALVAVFWGVIAKALPYLADKLGIVASAWAWFALLFFSLCIVAWFEVKNRERWTKKIHDLIADLDARSVEFAAREVARKSPPEVHRWFSPADALDQFVERKLLENALSALNSVKAFQARLNKSTEDFNSQYDSELTATLARMSQESEKGRQIDELRRKLSDAQTNLHFEKNKAFADLTRQLKEGSLISRGLPFENNRLEGDWEYIKAAFWSVLSFDNNGSETVSGGGKTYRGVQIGKPH